VNTAKKRLNRKWEANGPPDYQRSLIARFTEYVAARTGLQPTSYHDLWEWSVRDIDRILAVRVGEYFRSVHARRRRWRLAAARPCPAHGGCPGAQLNYVARVVANSRPEPTCDRWCARGRTRA